MKKVSEYTIDTYDKVIQITTYCKSKEEIKIDRILQRLVYWTSPFSIILFILLDIPIFLYLKLKQLYDRNRRVYKKR